MSIENGPSSSHVPEPGKEPFTPGFHMSRLLENHPFLEGIYDLTEDFFTLASPKDLVNDLFNLANIIRRGIKTGKK